MYVLCMYIQYVITRRYLGMPWNSWMPGMTQDDMKHLLLLLGDLLGEGASQYFTCIDDIPTFLFQL